MRDKLHRIMRLLLAFVCLLGLFSLCEGLAVYRDAAGVRPAKPLTAAQTEAARRAAARQGLDIAFWRQESGQASAGIGRSAAATAVACSGQASLCLPVACRAGSLPSGTQRNCCAVSTALAGALWGSTDVTGLRLAWNGKLYTVTGVFAHKEAVLVYLCGDAGGWNALELAQLPPGDPAGAVEQLLLAAGVQGQIVPQGMLYRCCALLCWLPLLLASGAAMVRLARFLGRQGAAIYEKGALLLLPLAVAALVPRLLARLPRWLIPGKWSGAAFWRGIFAQGTAALHTVFFALPPSLRDEMLAERLLLWLACFCAAPVVQMAQRRAQQSTSRALQEASKGGKIPL